MSKFGGLEKLGAPTDATYITQTPNAALSAEQALNSLSDGILKHASGIVSSLTLITTGYIDLPYGEMFDEESKIPLDGSLVSVPAVYMTTVDPNTSLVCLSGLGPIIWHTAFRIPADYDATADTISIKFSAKKDANDDVATFDIVAKKRTGIDAVGADLITTSVITISEAETEHTFDMSGGSLTGGDWIIVDFEVSGLDSDIMLCDNFRGEYTRVY